MRKITIVLFMLLFGSHALNAQQVSTRPSISSLITIEQQTLANLILQHIDANILTDHCDMTTTTGGDIHSDFDFLPFHRAYIQRLEDDLILSGNPPSENIEQ